METAVAPLLDEPIVSYIFVLPLGPAATGAIERAQNQLEERFPGLLWLPRGPELHVTVLHMISGDGHYPNLDKAQWFADHREQAEQAMKEAVAGLHPPKLNVEKVVAFPEAIIVKWADGGVLDAVRSGFTSRFEIPEGGRRPPAIVHTTIARFLKKHEFGEIEHFVGGLRHWTGETVPEVVMALETGAYMQQYEVLQRFPFA